MAFGIGVTLLITIITIAISGLLLWLSCKIMKVKSDWATPYIIALIVGVVGFVLGLIPVAGGVLAFIANIALGLWLVKTKYKLAWGKAVVVWLIWFVLSFILAFIIGLIAAMALVGSAVAGALG